MKVIQIVNAAKKAGIYIITQDDYRNRKPGVRVTGGTDMHPFEFFVECLAYGNEETEAQLVEQSTAVLKGLGLEASAIPRGEVIRTVGVKGLDAKAKAAYEAEQEAGRLSHLAHQLEQPWRMCYNRDEYRYRTRKELMVKAADLRDSIKRIGLWGGGIELFQIVESEHSQSGYERIPLEIDPFM